MASPTHTQRRVAFWGTAVLVVIFFAAARYLQWRLTHPSPRKAESFIVDSYGATAADCDREGDDFLCSVSFKGCTVLAQVENDGDMFQWVGTSNPLIQCPGYVDG